jgi:hypothetical protein
MVALERLLSGGGYDPGVSLIQEAFTHVQNAARLIRASDWAKKQVQGLVNGPSHPDRRHFQSALAQCLARCSQELD